MQRMRIALLSALTALVAAPALATDEQIIALSAQADQAFAEGRYDEADAAAEAAWRQAEIEWGAVEDTAFLADNLARQRIALDQRDAAREPAARVLDLAEQGLTPSIRVEEARLVAQVAALDPAEPSENAIAALEAALISLESAGAPSGQLLWSGWLDLSRGHYALENWDRAYAAGLKVMTLMDATANIPESARVAAGTIAGNSALLSEGFSEANAAYTWAMDDIPQRIERDGDRALNPSWATLAAWRSLARAAATSAGEELDAEPAISELDDTGAAACPPRRRAGNPLPIDLSGLGSYAGVPAAVIVEYEVNAEGGVENAVVAASVPVGAFGEAVRRAAMQWRYQPEDNPACLEEKVVVQFEFSVPSLAQLMNMPRGLTRAPIRK